MKEKIICWNIPDSESILTTGDSEQNKPEVKQHEEQSMEAGSDVNRSDDQAKEDREKRKEAKVGGLFSNHTRHTAKVCVSKATTDASVGGLFISWCAISPQSGWKFLAGQAKKKN